MKATIGLPVYNCERFISLSIQSVLNQTFSDFELIITDDGSTDKTKDVVLAFNDHRIKCFFDGVNRGIAYRLNEQIMMAKGKYFVRMDADDIMFPDRLEKQINYLEDHPEIDVIGSSAIVIDNFNNILGIRPVLLMSSKNIYKRVPFIHPTVIGRIKWFRTYMYSEDLSGVEDFDLWIRSYPYSSFQPIQEPLLFYRDPLVFSFNKYLFRQRQLRKCLFKYCAGYNLFYFTFIILSSYIKQILLFLSVLTHTNAYLISKRNKPLTAESKWKFAYILNAIISKCRL